MKTRGKNDSIEIFKINPEIILIIHYYLTLTVNLIYSLLVKILFKLKQANTVYIRTMDKSTYARKKKYIFKNIFIDHYQRTN